MTYTIDVHAEQPIITVTYHGMLNAKELAEAQQKVEEHGHNYGPATRRIFCIQDIRDARIGFLDGIMHSRNMMYAQRKTDAQGIEVNLVFVGMNQAAKFFMQLRQTVPTDNFRTSAVDSLDEALALIQSELAK